MRTARLVSAQSPLMQTPLEADLPPGCSPPPLPAEAEHPRCRPPTGHVICDICWEVNPPVNRMARVKTLPCPKLRLWAVKSVVSSVILWKYSLENFHSVPYLEIIDST